MANPAPQIDQRTAMEISSQLQDLLTEYVPDWPGELQGPSAALVGIFARFAEIIIQRLNRVPDKNFLAFLDLLGASRLPPQPARVPLTFSLAAGSATDAIVPVGTQVAAPPAEGEEQPVIFETERELVVTAAQLASVFVRDPARDAYADHSAIVESAVSPGLPVFRGNRRNEHILYLGHSRLLSFPQIESLDLTFTLDSVLQDERELKWELWDGAEWQEEVPVGDGTDNLTRSGTINLGAVTPVPLTAVNLLDNRWLRCRLTTPITRSSEALLGMVRESQLPSVSQIQMEVRLQRQLDQGLSPDLAFSNQVPIDLGKDFFPFGEMPKLNDTLYLASAEAFSKDCAQGLASASATVSLDVQVANSHLLPMATSVRPAEDLHLAWECWNGTTWQRVGTSTVPPWLSLLELDPLPPLTTADSVVVQGTGQKGAAVTVKANGHTAGTVPVGDDGRFAAEVTLSSGVNVITLIASHNSRTSKAWAVVFQGTLDEQKVQLVVKVPDLPVKDQYIDLEVDVEGEDAGLVSSVRVTNGANDAVVTESTGDPLRIPLAEGRNELLVEGLTVAGERRAATTLMVSRAAKPPDPDATTGFSDGTFALCQSGVVTLRLPDTVSTTTVNGQESYWLRVRTIRGNYGTEAAYKLENPLAPEEGFMLIPASFRPPLLSDIRIGYEQTLGGVPEVCLAYNNLEFENLTGAPPFEPFRPAPEPGNRPTLYLGFTLPPDRAAFPNRTLSLFSRVADVKYGQKAIPISPHHSKGSGDPGSAVTHRFTITNAASAPASLTLAVLGTIWPTDVVPQRMDLAAGESREAEVRVTIPSDAPVDSSDWGFVRLVATDAPTSEHSATFVTFAGTEPPSDRRLQLCWECWNGTAWGRLTVRDDAESFTRPGLIQFLAPPDFASRSEFGLDRHWVRVRWESGEYAFEPRLHRMLLNTTMAAQTITIRNETLGSSDGSEHQTFRTTRAPVLAGQQLRVREQEMPSAEERATIEREEGKDAISPAGGPREHWVRWHPVPDFYGSGPRDRHYVLDHLTGQIRFGDGLNGLIPAVGAGNIRMARYKTGGGAAGNRPAGTIVQLKTTVPYVDKAINTEAAAGGANAEALDLLLNRAPRTLRHRGRAVTLEDYQDLARQASPEVARARCVPLSNLVDDPLAVEPSVPGAVSVIIVPRSAEAKPLPSLELINRVQDYLEANGIPTADISVVGPLYVSVNVSAEIALASLEGASEVEHTVYQRLAGFLHPLTGGPDGTGWAFGREPHNSDFYALIKAVPGVDHVRTLQVDATEDQPGVRDTGRFLVYSGTHQIRLVFEEP